jgi:hypothetical protein
VLRKNKINEAISKLFFAQFSRDKTRDLLSPTQICKTNYDQDPAEEIIFPTCKERGEAVRQSVGICQSSN